MPNCFRTRNTFLEGRNRSIKREWFHYQGDITEFARQWNLSIGRIAEIIVADRRKIIALLRRKEQIDEELVKLLKREQLSPDSSELVG